MTSITNKRQIGEKEIVTVLPSQNGNTVMQSLDQQGYGAKLNKGCLEGYCGSCRCKLIEGTINYPGEPLAFIGDNELLPCYATAETPIKIKL